MKLIVKVERESSESVKNAILMNHQLLALHKIKFSLVKAFEIIYWITETKKGMSTKELAKHFGIHQTSAWRFKKKVQLAMSEEDSEKLTGLVEVDDLL